MKSKKGYICLIAILSTIVIVLAVLGTIYISGVSDLKVVKNGSFTEVPFTCYSDGDTSYTLYADTEHSSFKLCNEDIEIICPRDYLPLKIISVEEKKFIFCKKLFDEATCLLEYSDGRFTEIEMPDKFQEYLFRDAVYFEDHLETALYFVAYNTTTSYNQLFKFDLDEESNLEFADDFCTDLNFGDNNVDENVKMIVSNPSNDFNGNRGLFIMGTQYYYTYQTWVPYTLNRYPYDYEARLTEVYDDGKNKYYLTQSDTYSTMVLYDINDRSFRKELVLDENVITGEIALEAGEGYIKEVIEDKDLIALLEKDITSLQCGGTIEMGSNNFEGRIPWAQVYYLNGFVDFLMPEFSDNIKAEGFEDFQSRVRQRLDIELEILDQLITSETGLVSRRYHLNREEHISALHCDRIMQIMNRFSHYTGKEFSGYDVLYDCGIKYTNTVEMPVVAETHDINGVEAGKEYLITEEGTLFDNTVAPYNFMSAYVSNACLHKVFEEEIEEDFLERATDFVEILLNDATFLDFDSEYEWSYYYGELYHGWAEKYESNIPYFVGQTHTADISYRSMDAMAIIYAFKAVPELYDEEIIDYLRVGVETGKLFPFVNEALIECGYDKAEIPMDELRKWIRVHHSWNIQNTAWAYYFMLR